MVRRLIGCCSLLSRYESTLVRAIRPPDSLVRCVKRLSRSAGDLTSRINHRLALTEYRYHVARPTVRLGQLAGLGDECLLPVAHSVTSGQCGTFDPIGPVLRDETSAPRRRGRYDTLRAGRQPEW